MSRSEWHKEQAYQKCLLARVGDGSKHWLHNLQIPMPMEDAISPQNTHTPAHAVKSTRV